MVRLKKSLSAFGNSNFKNILQKELEQLEADQLPLQQGLSNSSYALGDTRKVMIISVSHDSKSIYVKAGIFYSGIIAGCSCADDPTPVDEISEYCEVQLAINKDSAVTTVTLIAN